MQRIEKYLALKKTVQKIKFEERVEINIGSFLGYRTEVESTSKKKKTK